MEEIKRQIINIGKAMLDIGLQNTHSGNISACKEDEMYITRAGSMKGHLTENDIVMPGLYKPKSCDPRPSSETGTHRGVLQHYNAVVHTHSLSSILFSMISNQMKPIDFLGKRILGTVPIVEFDKPTNSKEMEQKIPVVLSKFPSMIVKRHGPFSRGKSLNEAFNYMCITDYSAFILWQLNLLNIDILKIENLIFPQYNHIYKISDRKTNVLKEGRAKSIRRICNDIFKLKLSPFHTGSISIREDDNMIYTDYASCPEYLDNDFIKLKIKSNNSDYFHNLHRAVYQFTSAKCAILTFSPDAVIQSIILLNKKKDNLEPVDAEGKYLYPFVPVIGSDVDLKQIVELASKYKVVIIAGLGALAVGNEIDITIHHNSSLKNICYIKTQMEIEGNINRKDYIKI